MLLSMKMRLMMRDGATLASTFVTKTKIARNPYVACFPGASYGSTPVRQGRLRFWHDDAYSNVCTHVEFVDDVAYSDDDSDGD